MAKLSDKAKVVLEYLQEHNGDNLTHVDIAEELRLDVRTVIGTLTGLQKKGFIERIPVDGSKYKLVRVTPEGLMFDVEDDIPTKR